MFCGFETQRHRKYNDKEVNNMNTSLEIWARCHISFMAGEKDKKNLTERMGDRKGFKAKVEQNCSDVK